MFCKGICPNEYPLSSSYMASYHSFPLRIIQIRPGTNRSPYPVVLGQLYFVYQFSFMSKLLQQCTFADGVLYYRTYFSTS